MDFDAIRITITSFMFSLKAQSSLHSYFSITEQMVIWWYNYKKQQQYFFCGCDNGFKLGFLLKFCQEFELRKLPKISIFLEVFLFWKKIMQIFQTWEALFKVLFFKLTFQHSNWFIVNTCKVKLREVYANRIGKIIGFLHRSNPKGLSWSVFW